MTEVDQHYEVAWILGCLSLHTEGYRNPAADALPVIAQQMDAAETLFSGPSINAPRTLPLCNVRWENLYARMGAAAYLASSLATVPRLRAVLLGLIEQWRTSIFCARRECFRDQFGTLVGPLPRENSQWILEQDGTRFLVKVLTWEGAVRWGEPAKMTATVLSYAANGRFAQLQSFEPQTTLMGKDAPHQNPTALGELLDRVKREGPPAYHTSIGAELARRTDLPNPVCSLIWAGNTEANNALRAIVAPEVRKVLGLKVKDVEAASPMLKKLQGSCDRSDLPWWYNISGGTMPRQRFYDLYQQAMPVNPSALWAPLEGGEDSVVARLARAISRFDMRS